MPKKSDIIFYIGTLAVIAGVAFLLVHLIVQNDPATDSLEKQKIDEQQEESVDDSTLGRKDPVYTFDSVEGNTADTYAARFFSMQVIGVFRKRKFVSELKNSEVLRLQIHDLFITTFTARTVPELQSHEIKEELKRELKEGINGFFEDKAVKEIIITKFIITQ